jgi:uncharacterized transporter YbjL
MECPNGKSFRADQEPSLVHAQPSALTIATIVAHRVLHLNPVIICGALAGAMTVDAAVTGCCERADSQTPVLGVAVPYAVGNVLLTVLGPVIVTLTYAG